MRRLRDKFRRPRLTQTFDERVEAAKKAIAPQEPLAYVFTPEEGRGFFKVKAITELDLKIKNPKKV